VAQGAICRLEPRDHRYRDAVALGDRRQGLASITALNGLSPLIIRKLPLAAELHAVRQGPFTAIPGTFPDQLRLEISDRSKQCRQQPSLR
jgi:hypothetical protein